MTTFFETTSTPPAWLRWFANDAARSILETASHAPIGCHYHYAEECDEWEVAVLGALGGNVTQELGAINALFRHHLVFFFF